MTNNNACTTEYRPSILNVLILGIVLTITTLLISPHAKAATMAGSYHMIVNGKSYHIERTSHNGQKFNENNFGSGLQYDFSRQYGARWVPFVTSSAFQDSFNNISYYVGGGEMRRFYLSGGWHVDVGYVGFMMARKDFDNYKPFPGALPVASIGTRNIAVNMTYIPDLNDKVDELLFFQLKVSI